MEKTRIEIGKRVVNTTLDVCLFSDEHLIAIVKPGAEIRLEKSDHPTLCRDGFGFMDVKFKVEEF